MAIVPFTILTGKGVEASVMLCSDKRYKEYMEKGLHKIFPYAINALAFKQFLRDSLITFEEVESPILTWSSFDAPIQIWNDAITIDLFDIREICTVKKLNFNTFIDFYAQYLKSILGV